MFRRFIEWFDSLKDERKFLTFLSIVFCLYIPFCIAFVFGTDWLAMKIFLAILGFCLTFCLSVLMFVRHLRKQNGKK